VGIPFTHVGTPDSVEGWKGLMGSYHKVIRKYLPLYVAEFQFRVVSQFQSALQ